MNDVVTVGTKKSDGATWRNDAVAIVDALFPVCPTDTWDLLLDLRVELLAPSCWERVLDLFLICRERLELDHYLPFYRLRRLISNSLRLECGVANVAPRPSDLAALLALQPRSLAEIKRTIRREWFEHDVNLADPQSVKVRLTEIGR